MPTTYSSNLRLSIIATGEQSGTWGTTTNTNLGTLLEQAISGQAAVTHDDAANYTLTANNGSTDESRQAILNIAGTLTAARNAVVPTVNKLYVAKNATVGGYNLVVKTSGGTGITIPNGNTAPLRCDATNVLGMFDWLPALTVGGNLVVNGATNLDAGTVSLPGLYFEGETSSGIYRIAANNHGYAISGAKVLDIASTGLAVTGTFSASGLISAGTPATAGHVISYESLTSVASPSQTRGSFYGYKTGANYYGLSFRGGFDGDGSCSGAVQLWQGTTSGLDALTFTTAGASPPTLGVAGIATFSSDIVMGAEGKFALNSAGIDAVPAAGKSFRVLNSAMSAWRFSVAESTGNTVVTGTLTAGAPSTTSVSLTVNGAVDVKGVYVETGFTASGGGGNYRCRRDTGTVGWTSGILGSAGAVNWSVYDIASSAFALDIAPGVAPAITTYGNLTITGSSALRGSYGGGGVTTNLAIGDGAIASNATGTFNTAVGYNALNAVTTGAYNTALGSYALLSNLGGGDNIAVGGNALAANLGGSYNTAVGYNALGVNTSGSGNTGIGPITSGGTYSPVFNPTTQNDRFCMGSTTVTNAYIQVAWTVVSDARDKTDFAPVPHGLDFVCQLQPTAYRYKECREATEGHGPVRYGFKAQEVLALEGSNPVIVDAEDADKLRFNDQSMIAVLVNALQELNAKFDAYVLTHP